jgi:cytochrome b561
MVPARNSDRRYGAIAMALHWAMALLLIVLVVMGLYMTRLPDVGFDRTKVWLIIYHKELGIAALGLAAARLAWRFGNELPSLVGGMPEWQQVAARFVHLCFYALMFALPISGWLMSSAAGFPVPFFGLFYLPDLIGYNEHHFQVLLAVHKALGYAMVPFILVHTGAALHHHFVSRDETLRRMLPAQPS